MKDVTYGGREAEREESIVIVVAGVAYYVIVCVQYSIQYLYCQVRCREQFKYMDIASHFDCI